MPLGKYNHIVLTLTREVAITGNANERDVAGPHVILPVDAELISVYGSCQAVQTASVIQVYAGAAVATGTAVLSTGMSFATATLTATGTLALTGKKYSRGQEFALSENTTNSATVTAISVQLTFRVRGA